LIKLIKKSLKEVYAQPWVMICAVAILLVVVVILAVRNFNREERYMTQILSEKGSSLIKAFEAGARTGIVCTRWGVAQVQTMIEEFARQPGIMYLALTDRTGLILAHNNRSMIGQKILDDTKLRQISPDIHERWRLSEDKDGQTYFEVYRYMRPWSEGGCVFSVDPMPPAGGFPKNNKPKPGGNNDWHMSVHYDHPMIIFVGLDMTPFEEGRQEDIRNTVIISSILLLLGFGGFFLIFLTQSYRTSRSLLQDTTAFAKEVVNNLPVGLIATDRNGKVAFFNEAAEKITGLVVHNVRGKDLDEILPQQLSSLRADAGAQESILEKETKCNFGKAKAVPLSVSAAHIVNEAGKFVGDIIILRDLREIRGLQKEIQRKEKLAVIGGLAAGIAHEVRNPLSSIKGLATFFKNKFPMDSEDREAAAIMVGEADRLNRVISGLLEYAKPSDLDLKPTNINDLLEHSIRLIRPDAMVKNIRINLSKDDALPMVDIDPDRFSQCLLNLYLNAIEAIDNDGVLSVRSLRDKNENLKVEIEDTGKGIDSVDLTGIFDPYFTTKTSGTGLGLAIVQKIIESHNGRITVSSIPGKGSLFTLIVPVHPDLEETGP
jgi:two-component system sensor histidine kinase HydH